MTETDDAGLVDAFAEALYDYAEFDSRHNQKAANEGKAAIVGRLRTQRREIEELRRELAEATKFVKFVSSHANYIGSGRYEVRFADVWHRSASAFAAKHGGRDG